MKEKDLQKGVVDIAHRLGYVVAHFRASFEPSGRYVTAVGADGKGFPDLVLARPGRLLFIELKCGYNKLRPDQEMWQDALLQANAEYYLLRETDYNNGTVEEILK